MIPAVFVRLEKLPLSPSGKVDAKRLPVPEDTEDQAKASGRALSPVEEIVATIWRQLLPHSHIDADDSFFELGGHSLLATQVVSRIEKAFGAKISLGDFFDHPTLSGLAKLI